MPTPTSPRGLVELKGVAKTYDGTTAVAPLDLRIEPGEFFALLGSSGCGKTTTLRMIGGFTDPDSGSVVIDGVDVTGLAPNRRPVNTVFQNYALFPHLSVAANVAFGLRYAGIPKSDRARLVDEALDLVQLGSAKDRKIDQLSGGQQQRIALARAIVLRPSVVLLDEPLGALDAQLRRELQIELKSLQAELGMTFVYITHDQHEALTMADRLAVMRDGRVEQLGTPREVYERPASAFVATFLGHSNVVVATLRSGPYSLSADADGLQFASPQHTGAPRRGRISIRPERVSVAADPDGRLQGTVAQTSYNGASVDVRVELRDGATIVATLDPQRSPDVMVGSAIGVSVDPRDVVVVEQGSTV
jgi:spermidine/putrescine transport system ATP-binding protein